MLPANHANERNRRQNYAAEALLGVFNTHVAGLAFHVQQQIREAISTEHPTPIVKRIRRIDICASVILDGMLAELERRDYPIDENEVRR